MSKSNQRIDGYTEVSKNWDIERLFKDLGDIKVKHCRLNSKGLSPTEKEYLCLLLSYYSPKRIAKKRRQTTGAVRTELSKSIYVYIQLLIEEEISEWTEILFYLSKKGYKLNPQVQQTPTLSGNASSIESVLTFIHSVDLSENKHQQPMSDLLEKVGLQLRQGRRLVILDLDAVEQMFASKN